MMMELTNTIDTKTQAMAINYEVLMSALDITKTGVLKYHQEFYVLLDKTYFACKNYAEDWLSKLEIGVRSARNQNFFMDVMRLYQFVSDSEVALRRVIAEHDNFFPHRALFNSWRWKLEFGYTQRILLLLQTAMRNRDLRPPVYEGSRFGKATHLPSRYSGVTITENPLYTSLMADDMSGGMGAGDNSYQGSPSRFGLFKRSYQTVSNSIVNDYDGGFVQHKFWIHNHDLPNLLLLLTEHCVPVNTLMSGTSLLPWSQISSMFLDDMSRDRCRLIMESTQKSKSNHPDANSLQRDLVFHVLNGNENEVNVELLTHRCDEFDIGGVDAKRAGYNVLRLGNQSVVSFLNGQEVPVSVDKGPLCGEMQELIMRRRLYPTYRVDYNRVAFQPADHDHLRVSVDLNMRYVQERTTHKEWRTPEERFLVKDIIPCSYSLVEVSLQGSCIDTPPRWLEELLDSSLLHQVDQFSKRVHATFAFSMMERNGYKLPEPKWWSEMSSLHPNIPTQKAIDEAAANSKIKMLEDSASALGRDPMSVFRNERTFLSWFSTAMYLCGIGLSLRFALPGNVLFVGVLLLFLGCAFVVYAAYQHVRRSQLLLEKVGQMRRYYDGYGPLCFSLIFSGIFILALSLHIVVKK